MFRLRSADGTWLACERSGAGPALALVHGSGTDRKRWRPALGGLEAHCTVYALDRRGHGESADAEPYALEREIEDLTALAAVVGEGPMAVCAHSFGAVCALGAAGAFSRLVLYEPPLPARPGAYFRPALIDAMREALGRGDSEAAAAAFAAEVFGATPAALAAMRRGGDWSRLCAGASRTLRELEAVQNLDFDALAVTRAPTLLLLGADSGPQYRATAERLLAVLPGARLHRLEGQGHGAIDKAPVEFAAAVTGFLIN